MIFRAIFWIGLVAVLMPREPDLGFGRPGADSAPAADTVSALRADFAHPERICATSGAACADGVGVIDDFRAFALRSLTQIKSEIAASQRSHVPRQPL